MKKKSTAKKIKLPPLPVFGKAEPPPDLSRFTEATRSAVHSHVFMFEFSTPFLMGTGWRYGAEFPLDAAERTELTVFHAFGRWFAAWRDSEINPHLPLEHRWRLVQVKAAPTGLTMEEI